MRPKRSTVAAAKASTAASSETSSASAWTPAPAASHWRATSRSGSRERPQSASEPPRREIRSAAARPIPLEAPVITTTACSSGTGIGASAETLFLGGLVGDLEEVGESQRGEDRRQEPGQPGGEEQPEGKGGDDPEAEAVRADQQLADRPAGAGP